jgi:formate/nitrite transporter FocA (FNT family)
MRTCPVFRPILKRAAGCVITTGVAFALGLILVVVAGAELFTGNNLLVMAWADGKISTSELLRSRATVCAGNSIGAVGLALLVDLARHPDP